MMFSRTKLDDDCFWATETYYLKNSSKASLEEHFQELDQNETNDQELEIEKIDYNHILKNKKNPIYEG